MSAQYEFVIELHKALYLTQPGVDLKRAPWSLRDAQKGKICSMVLLLSFQHVVGYTHACACAQT